jgi:hypothetical protein
MSKKSQFSTFISPLLACFSLASLIWLQKSRLNQVSATQSPSQVISEQNKQAASLKFSSQLPTTSYRNLVANWRFLEYFQYFGDVEARKITGYKLIPDFFAEIVRNDPKFVDAYLYLSPANSLYAGRPDRTVALMSEGLPYLSPKIKDAYFVWLYKGVDELLFFNNIVAAKNSYQMASLWAAQQNDESSRQISQSARQTVRYLQNNSVSRTAQIQAWMSLMANARGDQNLQRFILRKVIALGANVTISTDGSLEVTMPSETNEPTPKQSNPANNKN